MPVMGVWQPEEGGLRQLSEYLKNSLSGHDREKQKEAEQVSLYPILKIPPRPQSQKVDEGRCRSYHCTFWGEPTVPP